MTPYFIEKHPTPWKITTVRNPQFPDLDAHEEIQDANGNTIIAAYDAESYFAGFKGPDTSSPSSTTTSGATNDHTRPRRP